MGQSGLRPSWAARWVEMVVRMMLFVRPMGMGVATVAMVATVATICPD